MTEDEFASIETLLRDLLTLVVDEPAALEIARQPGPGSCYWMLRCAPDDESKITGVKASHVKAIAALLSGWGAAEGERHTFRFLHRQEPRPRPRDPAKDVMHYDTEPARLLLIRCLEKLDLAGFGVACGPGGGARHMLTFEFSIHLMTESDNGRLIQQGPPDGFTTLLAALGTIFRAIGRKAGVKIEIVITRPQ